MKIILIMFLLVSHNAFSTNYYVSNSGSDAATGTSTGAAWQTLAKVNSFTFSDGDSILFNRGDRWNEKMIVPHANIHFGAYGAGSIPVFTGLYTPTGYTDSSNVWSTTLSGGVGNLNTVVVDGKMVAKGRSPGVFYPSASTYNYIKYAAISGNHVGDELAVVTRAYILDIVKVASQNVDTMFFSPSLTYSSSFGGVFYQNVKRELNLTNEWCINTDTKELSIYKNSTPTGVQASKIDTLVYAYNKPGITFNNILFEGANKAALLLDSCIGFKVKNCSGLNNGESFLVFNRSDSFEVKNNSIANTWSNALYQIQPSTSYCNHVTIQGNYILNTGMSSGMGQNGNVRNMGIWLFGNYNWIKENTIDSTGYNGMYITGSDDSIKNNIVTNAVLVKSDGGAIYTFNYLQSRRGYIGYNYVKNVGSTFSNSAYTCPGIYLDNNSKGWTVENNYVENTCYAGIFFHQNDSITVRNNTVVDSTSAVPLFFNNDYGITNSTFTNNIHYQKSSVTAALAFRHTGTNLVIDSNYYLRPTDSTTFIYHLATNRTLSDWSNQTGYDIHSQKVPSGVTSALPLIITNPTLVAASTSLTGAYIDARGNVYNNSINLQPFGSAILFKATNEIVIPSQIFNYGFKNIQL